MWNFWVVSLKMAETDWVISTANLSVAKAVQTQLLPMIADARTSLFLIGKDASDTDSIRADLLTAFNRPAWNRVYRVIYPEVLFSEFVYQREYDMLTLENALANGVRAVVVCVESPGSFAELGAFGNHAELSKRMIVVCEAKFKTAKSFLTRGPIKHIQKTTGSVIWYDPKDRNALYFLMSRLRKEIESRPQPAKTITNPVVAEDFVLPYLYVAGPLSKDDLIKTVELLDPGSGQGATIACGAALTMLFRQRAVQLEGNRYSVTPSGLARMLAGPRSRRTKLRHILDELRASVLNSRLRRAE